jgi:hypothetical protein
MKEFSTHLILKPLVPTREDIYTFFADRFDFVPSKSESAAGTVYKCDKDFIIEIPAPAVCREFSTPIPCQLQLKDSKNNPITLGTPDIPALADITPHLNTATLSIKCTMLNPPYEPHPQSPAVLQHPLPTP